MVCGVYKILNTKNGKFYIGSSKDIDKRWYTHLNTLRRGTHHSVKLQNAFNKHGEKVFILEIVELCDIEVLLDVEQSHIDNTLAYRHGYNMSMTATGYTSKWDKLFDDELSMVTEFYDNVKYVADLQKDFKLQAYTLNISGEHSPKSKLKRIVEASKIIRSVVDMVDEDGRYKLNYCNYIPRNIANNNNFEVTNYDKATINGVERLLSLLHAELSDSDCGRALLKRPDINELFTMRG